MLGVIFHELTAVSQPNAVAALIEEATKGVKAGAN
jgi:hypothetical protein